MDPLSTANGPIALHQVTASTVAAVDPRLQSNAGAIAFEDFVIAIDAGMRPFASRMLRIQLESAFGLPVGLVGVTHKHGDHTFGLVAFKDVPVFGSSRLAEALERSPDFAPEARAARKAMEPDGGEWLDEVEQVLPTLRFHERMDVANHGMVVEFHHTGGHTDCSTYAYLPDERVLFSGDLIFAGMFPFAGDDTADPEVWMSTLRLWMTMPIDHVIPGHGPVCGPEEIGAQLEWLETLKHNTLAAIEAGAGAEGVVLPPMYPIGEKPWFAEKTVQRWHEYYSRLV